MNLEEPGETNTASSLLTETQGLRLPPETRTALGLQTGEASARTLQPQRNALFQVLGMSLDEDGTRWCQGSALVAATSNPSRLGHTILLSVPGSSKTITGSVIRIEKEVQSALDQIEIVGRWPAPSPPPVVGSVVRACLLLDEVKADLAVPTAAVVRAALGDFAYVSEAGFLKRVAVRLGRQDDHWIEVLGGLTNGQSVVIRGAEGLWLLELGEAGGMTNLK